MGYGNVTIDPLSFAVPAATREIEEVLDLDTGEYLDVAALVRSHRYQDLVEARGVVVERMNGDRPRYACALCGVPVYFVSTPEKHFFFRHRVEDGSCPARTRSPLTMEEITARKYHGLRESAPHIRIKGLIERSLAADPAFTAIAVEATWRASRDPKSYRRPDVQANGDHGRIAFEVQLSTTFLSVVVDRRLFYRDEGALLIWVFGAFEPSYRRLTTDDLLFSNNSNIFVVDDETAKLSVSAQALHLRCHYRRPVRKGDEVESVWEEAIVPFHALAQDRAGQQTFLFDYKTAEQALRDQIARDVVQRASAEAERAGKEREVLRQSLLTFWREKDGYMDWTSENVILWNALHGACQSAGVPLLAYPDQDGETRAMLHAMLSAHDGRPVGWNFKTLTQVAHHLAVSHPRQLLIFGYAARHFNRDAQIAKGDKSGKWKIKSEGIKFSLSSYHPDYLPEERLLPLATFLFPEIGQKVAAYLARAKKSLH